MEAGGGGELWVGDACLFEGCEEFSAFFAEVSDAFSVLVDFGGLSFYFCE